MKKETSQFPAIKDTKCDYCGEEVPKGSTMFYDEFRGEHFCEKCEEEYWQEVYNEEGEHGERLK